MKANIIEESGQTVHYNLNALYPAIKCGHLSDELWCSGGVFHQNPRRYAMKAVHQFWAWKRRSHQCFLYQGETAEMGFYGIHNPGFGDDIGMLEGNSTCEFPTAQFLIPKYLYWDGIVERAAKDTYENTRRSSFHPEGYANFDHFEHRAPSGLLSTSLTQKCVEEWLRSWNAFATTRLQGVTLDIRFMDDGDLEPRYTDYMLIRVEADFHGDYFMERLRQGVLAYRRSVEDQHYCSGFIQ